MPELSHTESIVIGASPDALYDLLTDIARTGEWSPICKACWWRDGDSLAVGSWFYGRNEADGRTWETESEVVAAERGVEFAWLVGGAFARWGYAFAAVDGGTQLTESWQMLPAGVAMFRTKYGDEADERIALRADQAHAGIPATLATIKRIAESEIPAG